MKKTYTRPEVVNRGDIRQLTQGWGPWGLGDLLGGNGGDGGSNGTGSN